MEVISSKGSRRTSQCVELATYFAFDGQKTPIGASPNLPLSPQVLTWQQLGFHSKPIGLLNIRGFFNPLIAFFSHCVTEVALPKLPDQDFLSVCRMSVCFWLLSGCCPALIHPPPLLFIYTDRQQQHPHLKCRALSSLSTRLSSCLMTPKSSWKK